MTKAKCIFDNTRSVNKALFYPAHAFTCYVYAQTTSKKGLINTKHFELMQVLDPCVLLTYELSIFLCVHM